jgi:hypothetical protein
MTRLVFGVLCGLTLLMCRPALAADSVFREYPKEWYLQRQVFRNGSPNSAWRADAISSAVQTISRRLEMGVGLPAQFAEVTVTTCSEQRAAVYAGGWVEVCLPLLLYAETEDEVAFVLGHEMSHIIADHLPQNPNEFYRPSVAEEVLADELGLRMAVAAGYSPDGAFSFFDKIDTGDPAAQRAIAGRQDALAELVEREFVEESDTREFTLFSTELASAQQEARAYLAEMEEVFADTIAMVNSRENSPDGFALAEDCREVFSGLEEIHDTYGFIELTIHSAAAANYWCRFREGTTDTFRRLFMSDVNIDAMSYSLLGVIAVTGSLDPSGGIAAIMLEEYRRRALMVPEAYPNLKGRAAMKNRALFTTARFLAGCRAVGFIDEEWAIKRYTELTPQLRAQLLSAVSAPQAVDYVMSECNNTLNYSRNEKRRAAQAAYEARIAAGQSAETAAQMANDMARHWIALIYVRDSWVVNRIIRGE